MGNGKGNTDLTNFRYLKTVGDGNRAAKTCWFTTCPTRAAHKGVLLLAAAAATVTPPAMLGSALGIAIQPVMPDGGCFGKNTSATPTEATRNRAKHGGRCLRTRPRLRWRVLRRRRAEATRNRAKPPWVRCSRTRPRLRRRVLRRRWMRLMKLQLWPRMMRQIL